jgi:hypothetical protein
VVEVLIKMVDQAVVVETLGQVQQVILLQLVPLKEILAVIRRVIILQEQAVEVVQVPQDVMVPQLQVVQEELVLF